MSPAVAPNYAHTEWIDDTEPDWRPLERLFSNEVCGSFMSMGVAAFMFEEREGIRLYKHRMSRRYLNLTPDGHAWRYVSHGPREVAGASAYESISISEALAAVFDGVEVP